MDTLCKLLIGPEPTTDVATNYSPVRPQNMPRNFPPESKIMTIFQEQQRQVSTLQGQVGTLIERSIKLENDNKELVHLLNHSHDLIIADCIQKVFNAIKMTPGFAARLQKQLGPKEKPPLYAIIEAIDTLLKEDQKKLQEVADGWILISSEGKNELLIEEKNDLPIEEKNELRIQLSYYYNAIRLLGESMSPQLPPDKVELLLAELAEMSLDPKKAQEAQSRLRKILGYLGTGTVGTFNVLFVIYKEAARLNAATGIFTFLSKGTLTVLWWALRVALRI